MPISAAYFKQIKDFEPHLRDALLSLAEELERSRQDAVPRDEFRDLRAIVKELAEAQKRTEIRVGELAEAQKRTERELRLLTEEHRKTRQQLGGLSATVGYRLEDEAYKGLPPLLSRDFGLELDTPLRRRFIPDRDGALLEVNIIGAGRRDGRKVTVIGEAKIQLSKRLVNEFLKKRLSRFEVVFEEILPVLVTYMISEPDAEDYARQKGLAVYYSYEF